MRIPDYVDLKLQIEEMYFDAATSAFAQANSFRDLIKGREGALAGLHLGEAYDWGDEIDPDEEMWEEIEKAEDHLAEAFGKFM